MTVGNPYFKIFNIFDKFITNNIIDINSIRANKSTPKERRWIYPGYPEKNDENYPRIAIKFGTPSFEDVGANNFIEETIDNSTIVKSNYGFLMNTNVTLFVFIKKDQVHNVAYYDGSQHPTKNEKQIDFLTGNIITELKSKYNDFVNAGLTLGKDISSISTYEENDFLFAAEIEIPVQIMVSNEECYSEEDIIATIINSFEGTVVATSYPKVNYFLVDGSRDMTGYGLIKGTKVEIDNISTYIDKDEFGNMIFTDIFGTTTLNSKADKTNVLELDNTDVFTPDADYEPATKKYVDDNEFGGAHIHLTDMPSSSNSDHDGRYYTETEINTMFNDYILVDGSRDMTGYGLLKGTKVEVDDTSTYIDKDGSGNMTFTDAITGTRTLKNIGCPVYHFIKAETQSEGDLHLSDVTNWNIDKAMISIVRVKTNSTDWDLYILQNDNGFAADDANIPKLQLVASGNGDADINVQLPYHDEDDSKEVHLYYLDNAGTDTADIYVIGWELI